MRGQDLVVLFPVSTGLREKTFGDDEGEGELIRFASFEYIAFWQKRSLQRLREVEKVMKGLSSGSGRCCAGHFFDISPSRALEGD